MSDVVENGSEGALESSSGLEEPSAAPDVSIVLGEHWPGRVRGGIPTISLDEIPSGVPDQPGSVTPLRSPEGELLAFGLHDPENHVLRVLPTLPHESSLDLSFFRKRVRRAVAWRRRVGLFEHERSAFRLIHGEGDGLSGFLAEFYAGHVVLYSFSKDYAPLVDLLARAIVEELGPISVISKVRPAGETPVGRVDFKLHHGEAPPREVIVEEDGCRYEVHLLGGINTGLFCDMREVRRAISSLATGQRVLNTFSYTGSFSVVAALAHAKRVTTVEFASGVLQWSKTNFELNGLDPADPKYRFVRGDVFDFLKQAKRKERQFDLIILDPPGSTSAPGRRWYLETDYDRLIGHALGVLAPEGLLLIAANTHRSRPEKIENQIRAAARDHGRRLRLLQSFGLPQDFPTQMIHPEGRYLKCFLVGAQP